MAAILLIEPDRLLARQYARALESAGYQVTTCLDGQAAIAQADKHIPDAIVLELQLKGHNGVEFLYELRSYPEWQRLPVIVQSLVPTQAVAGIGSASLLNISAYLYKPATKLKKLVQTVGEVLTSLPAA